MDINIDVEQPELALPIELDVSIGPSYVSLEDKPQINGVELIGNKTAEDLGLQPKGDYLLRGEINIDGSISGDGFATKEELNKKANKSELSTVAFSGSYSDLKNRPTIPTVPTKTSQLTNDSGFITQHQNISHLATKTELNNKQDKLIAGNNITIVNNVISCTGGNSGEIAVDAYTKSETDNLLSGKQDKGNYALKNEIPTTTSQLTNNSGFLTQHQDISHLASKTELDNKQDKGNYALKSEIPTKTSSLTNDSGFLTEHQDISGKQDKLIAGENITIVDNVISSTGGSGGSVDLSGYATKQFAKDANFPSSRYDELTLGASGSKYVAPANGWFVVHKKSGKEKSWLNIETPLFMSSYMSPSSGEIVTVRAEVLKGTQISVTYDMPGETKYFRFVYSQGENDNV